MKKITSIASAAALCLISYSTIAAEQATSQPAPAMTQVGVVSIGNAHSLTDLEARLAAKAEAAGAKAYYITSAGGGNKLHGTAIIYR